MTFYDSRLGGFAGVSVCGVCVCVCVCVCEVLHGLTGADQKQSDGP